MEHYSAIKRNTILIHAIPWMNLETNMLSEINQTQRDKYYMISLIWEMLGELQLNGYSVFVWDDENILELDSSGKLHKIVDVLNATELDLRMV